MAGPRPRPRQQPAIDVDRMIADIQALRNRFDSQPPNQPLPRQELEAMRTQLQRMSFDLAEHARRFPNQQPDEVKIARSYLNGLMADLDHVLFGRQGPQQQSPPTTPQQRQRAPGLPVPSRVRAPQRSLTYEVAIGPLPTQRFRLTLPPGETIQSLYAAAVQRGQVVDRESQAGALTLDGRPARPQEISGAIPPSAAVQNPSEPQMLGLLMLHNCFAIPPARSPAGGDYTSGGGGHIAGFEVVQVHMNQMTGPQLATRSQRLDTFRDDYLAQQSSGFAIRVAAAPPAQQGKRRRRI